jgi:hypothetical protein
MIFADRAPCNFDLPQLRERNTLVVATLGAIVRCKLAALPAGFRRGGVPAASCHGGKFRMIRNAFIGPSIILAAIAVNFLPLLSTHPEQDDCSFGPVSNADYRGYLARARAHSLIATPSIFYVDDRAVATKLNDIFENLSRGKADVYSRIAIMHATLRSVGAEYRNTNGNNIDEGRSDPFVNAENGTVPISFQYLLDVNRLWVFSPWPREAWAIGNLAGPRYQRPSGPLYPEKTGEITFIFHGPTLERPLGFALRRDSSCPPFPTMDIADNFSLTVC